MDATEVIQILLKVLFLFSHGISSTKKIYVTHNINGTTDSDCGSAVQPCWSLQQAIDNSNATDVIVMDRSYTYDITSNLLPHGLTFTSQSTPQWLSMPSVSIKSLRMTGNVSFQSVKLHIYSSSLLELPGNGVLIFDKCQLEGHSNYIGNSSGDWAIIYNSSTFNLQRQTFRAFHNLSLIMFNHLSGNIEIDIRNVDFMDMEINNGEFFNSQISIIGKNAIHTSALNVNITGSRFKASVFSFRGLSTVDIDHTNFTQMGHVEFHNVKRVHIDHSLFKEGTSGAIYAADSKIRISNSIFKDNVQKPYGIERSILHFESTVLEMEGCQLENNTAPFQAGGTLNYKSNSRAANIKIKDTTIQESHYNSNTTYASAVTIISTERFYSKPSFFEGNVTLSCPLNHNKVYSYNNYYANFQFACTACGKGKYNVLQRVSIQWNDTQQGFTDDNSTCLECPWGATCNSDIKSKGHYWGFLNRTSGAVSFTTCPEQYCCDGNKHPCTTYHTCMENRQGRLCGECIENHSVSFVGHGQCVLNSKCKAYFWVAYFVLAPVYLVVFMYKDLLYLLSKKLLPSPNSKRNHVEANANENENESMDNGYALYTDNKHRDDGNIEKECHRNDNTDNYHRDVGDKHRKDIGDSHHIYDEDKTPSEDEAESLIKFVVHNDPDHTFQGIVKILFFFYQIASIVRVSTETKDTYHFAPFVDVVMALFNIRIDFDSNRFTVCPYTGADTIAVEVIKVGFSFAVLVTLIIVSCIFVVARRCGRARSAYNVEMDAADTITTYRVIDDNILDFTTLPFSVRLKCTYVQLLLLGFSTVALFSFQAVQCVEILGEKYIYIQANVKCYQMWQQLILAFIILWVSLFAVALYVGCHLLQKCKINSTQFLIILTMPIASIWYLCRTNLQSTSSSPSFHQLRNKKDAMVDKQILITINGPFRKRSNINMKWEPMIITRRLILVIMSTIIPSDVARMFLLTLMLIVLAIQHVLTQPYAFKKLNIAETLSFASLIVLAIINIFWAFSREVDITRYDLFFRMGHALMYVEMTILCAPFIALAYLCLMKLFSLGKFCCEYCKMNLKNKKSCFY